ncbi:YkgJ family cysteine cluster protein [Desulfoscipio gibsoniae]|uniref:Putative Fe-S oxidoreductase n=1 Tax=Desulfoscipio gibsoniae DSM 7213 TaxID=767817 RepID=R4KTV6_9FIRM|nr:YkgJ family cysteine cluster protein [Desulfoscipio gibsoniae]AGL03026.1 putative Fe-S oxidoreductase [Desulfoscipio gibsoniae DSM 7213]
MLPLVKLNPAISQAEDNNLFDKLEEIYNKLPEMVCDRCGTCCTVPHPAYIVEYLNMFRYVNKNYPEKWPQFIEGAVRYYFLELVDIHQRCPFLDEHNNCQVYEVRPFACRTYGMMGKRNTHDLTRRNMEKLVEKYRSEHNIELPGEIVEFELPYCEKVKVTNGDHKTPMELVQLLTADIGQLELFFVPMPVIESQFTFMPYVNHLVMSVVSEGARLRRPKVMQEFLAQGHSELLEKYIEKYRSTSF